MDTNNTPEHIVPPDYVVDANGVWRDLGEKRPPLRLTTSAAFVTALLRDVNATDWSVEIEFTNPDGEACTLLVPYAQILGRRDLSQMCTAVGLFVLPRGESEFADRLSFVMPTGTLLPSAETVPATGERLVFRPPFANPAFSAYASAGTFEESRELLERVRDDKVAIFVLCASISAPFLEAAGVDSIIVHLHGQRRDTDRTLARYGQLDGESGDHA